jgi:N utilization substance protein A
VGIAMPTIKLASDEIRYITLFETLTGAQIRDCIIDDDNSRIIFIVNPGYAGIAIGKNGINIKRIKKVIGKNIEIVEYADSIEQFIKNALYPARVKLVKVSTLPDNKKTVSITVDPVDKGFAIGKDGKNIQKIKLILKRYFDISNVMVA